MGDGFLPHQPGALPPPPPAGVPDDAFHHAELPAGPEAVQVPGFRLELSGAQFVWTMHPDRPATGGPLPKADEEQHGL